MPTNEFNGTQLESLETVLEAERWVVGRAVCAYKQEHGYDLGAVGVLRRAYQQQPWVLSRLTELNLALTTEITTELSRIAARDALKDYSSND